jgi:hypothetical protein
MFNKQETLDRMRINFTEAYKECLDFIFGTNAWERIKLKMGLSECQMELQLEECREYFIKEFSEAELFKFSLKTDEEIKNFFFKFLCKAQGSNLNEMIFEKAANTLPI